MATYTVGTGGDYPATQAGLMAAIAACGASGDTVRIIERATISSTLQAYPGSPATAYTASGKSLTLEGDPALYENSDPTTLPKILFGGGSACKALDDLGAGSFVKNLQFELFELSASGNAGGVINFRGRSGGGSDNLLFITCNECLQQSVDATHTRIRGNSTLALVRGGDNVTLSRWWVRLKSAATRVVDLSGIATTSDINLGSFYFPGTGASDIAFNLGGASTIRNVSGIRATNTGTGLFLQNGTRSYCTQTGFNTFGGTDGGNNATRDPLFVDGANADFYWDPTSLETTSGTAIGGVTEDIVGVPMPNEGGWARGAYSANFTTTITGATASAGQDTSFITLALAEEVGSDATWTDPGNYTVTSLGSGVAVTVTSVNLPDALTIELVTSEHTNGQPYNVAWAGLTNVTDGNDDFTGAGTPPEIATVTQTGGTTIRLVFIEAMANNAALTTAGNYTVTGATVTTVTRINATTVDITIAARIQAASAVVTATGPQDLALNPCSDSAALTVTYLSLVPPLTLGAGNTQITATFNVTVTGGIDETTDWQVEPEYVGAEVVVTGVTTTTTTATLTVHPALTRGATYNVTALNATAATGPIG